MDTPFKRAKTRSLRTAVGKAIVHIAKLQNLLEERDARIKHLEHMYSNAIYDLEQAEELIAQYQGRKRNE